METTVACWGYIEVEDYIRGTYYNEESHGKENGNWDYIGDYMD